MNFVLDASIALSWCFEDENTPATDKLLIRLENETAFVPTIWTLEIGNILVVAERKKRITYADILKFIGLLDKLNIQVDNEAAFRGFHDILPLAHIEKLTTYDAAYLELAMRKGLSLASKDLQLRKVASKLGVDVIPS
jgi:predicted nucleic acid-binding protein